MPVEQEPEISKIIEHALESRRRKAEAHRHSVLNSEEYIAQQKRLQRLTADFAYAAEFSGIAFTRYPHSRNWLLSTLVDELQESAYSIYVTSIRHSLAGQASKSASCFFITTFPNRR